MKENPFAMKENPDIDELLNSFIDEELTDRQRTEVQRLITHDAEVAKRLRELQKCKMLVGSLPRAEAPAEMLEQIKTSLEGRALVGRPERFEERVGARHLLVRKVLAAAAMIGLVAILAAVIYTIVAPENIPEKPGIVATVKKPVAETVVAAMGFKGRLELKTSDPIAVNAFISRAIEDDGLSGCISSPGRVGKGRYALSCSGKALSLLLADLENVWEKFDSATLFVEIEEAGGQVVVDGVIAEQVVEIANQDSLKKRIAVAKDFAALNSMAELFPGKEILAAIDNRKQQLITIPRIPKPVLTGEEVIKKLAGGVEGNGNVHLTIVVVGSK